MIGGMAGPASSSPNDFAFAKNLLLTKTGRDHVEQRLPWLADGEFDYCRRTLTLTSIAQNGLEPLDRHRFAKQVTYSALELTAILVPPLLHERWLRPGKIIIWVHLHVLVGWIARSAWRAASGQPAVGSDTAHSIRETSALDTTT